MSIHYLRSFAHLSAICLVTFSVVGGSQPRPLVQPAELQGDIRQVHDPAIIKEGENYYLFSTRAGIAIRCSKDLINWRLCGDVFAHLPEWAVKDVAGLRGLWAPDISFFNGKYHLYYSASTFGSNRSSIGLVTNQTLDATSDKYRWMDQGKVISSHVSDDWNAIDPNVPANGLPTQLDQTFAPKWVTDFSVSYAANKTWSATVGANNIFDVYPDRLYIDPRNNENNLSGNAASNYSGGLDNSSNGRFQYSRAVSQFGFNGRYVYGKIACTF